MVFSKEAFLRSPTGRGVRHLLADHLDILDGLTVTTGGGPFGTAEYSAGEEDFYLYPVMPEWCAEAVPQQLALF